MLQNHKAMPKQHTVQTKLVRSVRVGVAASRQREMMVIIANAENVESAQWQEDHLHLTE